MPDLGEGAVHDNDNKNKVAGNTVTL